MHKVHRGRLAQLVPRVFVAKRATLAQLDHRDWWVRRDRLVRMVREARLVRRVFKALKVRLVRWVRRGCRSYRSSTTGAAPTP